MNFTLLRSFSKSTRNREIFRVSLLVVTGLFSIGALIFPVTLRPVSYELKVGDVAGQDIQAPRSISYQSQVLTEEARTNASQQVAKIYLPADPAITRRQIERMHLAINYITTVRQDTYASQEQKLADLAALQDIQLSEDTRQEILLLNDNRWEIVQKEALSVLEQVMRRTIREDQLFDSQRSIPTLISFALPEDLAGIVAELVNPFVTPNSIYSAEQTDQARQAAINRVEPVVRTYVAGESIVRRGQVITPAMWEALREYGLIENNRNQQEILAAIAIVVVTFGFLFLYFNKRRIAPIEDLRGLLLTAIIFLVFLYSAKLLTNNHTILPYLFPVAAFGMTLGSLYNMEVGLIFSLVLSILTAYGMSNSLDLTLYYILSSLCGVLVLGKGRRIATFFTSGIIIGVVGSAVILAYRLPDAITDWLGIATLVGSAFLNGLASASLTLLLQFLFSQSLGITTALQLLDLARPDHPLLQYILRNAPGTYQHSLQVSNLAEQAAEAIGADALLTRVGAIYHDAGKAANPAFFIENQVPGNIDSHDEMKPQESAATIIHHVTDGIALARKHRLPARVQDFIREHHGTLITRYQYAKALEAAENNDDIVDIQQFRYPGPRPRSRETALLMLADGCEARARAELPHDEEELRAVIRKVIEFCQHEGQMDDTTLTMRDLSLITESFITTLRNTYHPRIRYPDFRPASARAEDQTSVAAETVPAVQTPVEVKR